MRPSLSSNRRRFATGGRLRHPPRYLGLAAAPAAQRQVEIGHLIATGFGSLTPHRIVVTSARGRAQTSAKGSTPPNQPDFPLLTFLPHSSMREHRHPGTSRRNEFDQDVLAAVPVGFRMTDTLPRDRDQGGRR